MTWLPEDSGCSGIGDKTDCLSGASAAPSSSRKRPRCDSDEHAQVPAGASHTPIKGQHHGGAHYQYRHSAAKRHVPADLHTQYVRKGQLAHGVVQPDTARADLSTPQSAVVAAAPTTQTQPCDGAGAYAQLPLGVHTAHIWGPHAHNHSHTVVHPGIGHPHHHHPSPGLPHMQQQQQQQYAGMMGVHTQYPAHLYPRREHTHTHTPSRSDGAFAWGGSSVPVGATAHHHHHHYGAPTTTTTQGSSVHHMGSSSGNHRPPPPMMSAGHWPNTHTGAGPAPVAAAQQPQYAQHHHRRHRVVVSPDNLREFVAHLVTVGQVSHLEYLLALAYTNRVSSVLERLAKGNGAGKPARIPAYFANGQHSSDPHFLGRAFLVCLILACKFSKEADDCVTNSAWADTAGLSVSEVNQLERDILQLLDYRLHVTPQEWSTWHAVYMGTKSAKSARLSLSRSNSAPTGASSSGEQGMGAPASPSLGVSAADSDADAQYSIAAARAGLSRTHSLPGEAATTRSMPLLDCSSQPLLPTIGQQGERVDVGDNSARDNDAQAQHNNNNTAKLLSYLSLAQQLVLAVFVRLARVSNHSRSATASLTTTTTRGQAGHLGSGTVPAGTPTMSPTAQREGSLSSPSVAGHVAHPQQQPGSSGLYRTSSVASAWSRASPVPSITQFGTPEEMSPVSLAGQCSVPGPYHKRPAPPTHAPAPAPATITYPGVVAFAPSSAPDLYKDRRPSAEIILPGQLAGCACCPVLTYS